MGRSSLALAAMLFMGLTVAHMGKAHPLPANVIKAFVDSHNAVRSKVGVGPMNWDETVAAYAQNYAKKREGECELVHSNGEYGENIFEGWGDGAFIAGEAVKLWADEKQNYDYNTNECQAGQGCGHYTQVVWRDSERFGCGIAPCNDGSKFVVCSYDPPGNYIGTKPY